MAVAPRLLALMLGVTIAGAAQAEGFASRDLSAFAETAASALGMGYDHRAEPERLTLFCPGCEDAPMIAVLIGRQTDGTEARMRLGETTIARLEELCQEREPRCRLNAIDVAPAIGWVTSYPLGDGFGATAIILRDGDMLTIRSL